MEVNKDYLSNHPLIAVWKYKFLMGETREKKKKTVSDTQARKQPNKKT